MVSLLATRPCLAGNETCRTFCAGEGFGLGTKVGPMESRKGRWRPKGGVRKRWETKLTFIEPNTAFFMLNQGTCKASATRDGGGRRKLGGLKV